MASSLSSRFRISLSSAESPAFGGRRLQGFKQQKCLSSKRSQVVAMSEKKVNSYDDTWTKQWFGAGIFNEDKEAAPVNIVKNLEKKKLLSQVEKAGLLSKAESAGISLSQIEKLGLLSKAEDLGLLSLAENFATSSPAALASFSLPLLVAAIGTIVFVPDDSTLLVVTQNVLAALFAVAAGGFFVSSIVLSALQEE